MPIDQGTLVYINFTAKVKDTDEAVETTLEEQAKTLGILDQNRKYEPRLIAVGEGWVLKGLDEELKKMEVGEKKTIELPPDKAWGERDPTLLRMIPLRKFGEKASDLRVGDVVEVDNRIGIVRFIGSGRAQIDFNHRLAGKTLIYDVETVKKLETDEEKISALIGRRFPGEGQKLIVARESAGEVVVDIPEELFLTEGLQIIKRGIGNDILHFVPSAKTVTFRERYVSPKKEAEDVEEEKKKVEEEEEEEKKAEKLAKEGEKKEEEVVTATRKGRKKEEEKK